MKIIDFMNDYKDWEQRLTSPPYNLKVSKKGTAHYDNDYILLQYDQTASDFNEQIVREARGLIISSTYIDNKPVYYPVCVSFTKFGNYGEKYIGAPELDWDTAVVEEKIDGSMIRVWWDQDWHISTSGCISAADAPVENDIKDFRRLFQFALLRTLGFVDLVNLVDAWQELLHRLNKNYSYTFELVSPQNKIVIPFKEPDIYHIGTYDKILQKEIDVDIGIKKPKTYPITSLEECIKAAKELNGKGEGFVVCDSNYNRIKVKDPLYFKLHQIVLMREPVSTESILDFTKRRSRRNFELFPGIRARV